MSLQLVDIDSWLRVAHTARHLRSSQLAHRLRRVVLSRLPVVRRTTWGVVSDASLNVADDLPVVPAFSRGCLAPASLVAELKRGELTLLNQTLPVGGDSGWRLGDQRQQRLWAITLHYHAWIFELSEIVRTRDPLADRASKLLCSFLQDWLTHCRLERSGAEALAWNAYAIATRLGWWARLWHSLGRSFWEQHADLAREFLRSMHSQAAYLAANLEWDLRANHLLRDAVGLAWAGRFFEGRDAARWLKTATRLAKQQANEQMLDDGGHFELSPFYHLEVMDDWLTLALLLREEEAVEKMAATWQRSAEYIRWLSYPDGSVVQFNDGAASLAAEHLCHGKAIGIDAPATTLQGGQHFKDSGVVVWHGDPWSVFFDAGHIGPDYQPGHAHADTLTLSCAYQGEQLFVDPGTFGYDEGSCRAYDRSTRAHNTVCIDQTNSSDVWHIFRVGRRAQPQSVWAEFNDTGMLAHATHNGYDRLSGKPRHHRSITVQDRGALTVTDTVSGSGSHEVEGGWLLSPSWRATADEAGWLLVKDDDPLLRVRVHSSRSIDLAIEPRPYHPGYGCEVNTLRLSWCWRGELPLELTTTLEPY